MSLQTQLQEAVRRSGECEHDWHRIEGDDLQTAGLRCRRCEVTFIRGGYEVTLWRMTPTGG